MATISAIRDALRTRLATISGLEVYDTVPGSINSPAAVIRRRSGPRPATFGSANHEYTFTVTVLASLADEKAGQDKLDELLSPDGDPSVMATIDADLDLGGTVEYAQISEVEADQVVEYAGVAYVGADIVVDVGAA